MSNSVNIYLRSTINVYLRLLTVHGESKKQTKLACSTITT